ncbi:Endonuclease/exonuclease/phosphatase [Cinara cedri]|uniref:Endonuclease/exonuclease/phosphatase n=1 Tax=Cinara cedri TaxID=506608 RepID=A0A5E4MKB3_9HEMI|nr:Endonuclease/exonuclease/phosphatase [Cinara cedri]
MSYDGRYSNQIDNILINERFANNITDERTYRGTDRDSDHFLVASDLRVKLKTMNRKINSATVKYDVEKLTDSRKSESSATTNQTVCATESVGRARLSTESRSPSPVNS